jgi:RNA polymerase sigma-54 factor
MVLELRQSLNLSQQLIMTPQLQQAIKLLQLSRLELLETIHEEMQVNPILEEAGSSEPAGETHQEGGEVEAAAPVENCDNIKVEDNPKEELDWEGYLSEYNKWGNDLPYEVKEFPSPESTTSLKTNLYDHLLWQLNMSKLEDYQKEIGVHLIGNLDENGYLDVPVEEIAASTGSSTQAVTEVLKVIQRFDPVGVGARNTRECLLLQIDFLGLGGSLVERLVCDHLQDLENRRYEQISRALDVTTGEIVSAVSVIQSLEPMPGRGFSDDEPIYIVPDIYVMKVGDEYEIILNEDGLPKLKINSYYKDILGSKDDLSANAKAYIQEKLRSAAWLIKSIHQRQRTIYRVTESIVRFQREFLDHGITHLKPLVLRDVAEDIQMHESTVSRVTTNKYVFTPQGIFELKFFFNSSIRRVEGDDIASESVKEHIRNIIKLEDKKNPYSDEEIADILKKMNIRLARRTVAKYRETLKILPSRKRRAPF